MSKNVKQNLEALGLKVDIITNKNDIKKISLGYKIVGIVGRKVKLKKPEGKNV